MKHPPRASLREAQTQLAIPYKAESDFFVDIARLTSGSKDQEKPFAEPKSMNGGVMVVAVLLALLVVEVMAKFPVANWLAAELSLPGLLLRSMASR